MSLLSIILDSIFLSFDIVKNFPKCHNNRKVWQNRHAKYCRIIINQQLFIILEKFTTDWIFIGTIFSTLNGKRLFSHIAYKSTILHSKWTPLKACCFFLISLRSIINLAHAFKSPFLDIEITITYTMMACPVFPKSISTILLCFI